MSLISSSETWVGPIGLTQTPEPDGTEVAAMGATIRDVRCGAAHLALSGDSSILDLRCRRCGVAALAPPDPAGLFRCGPAVASRGTPPDGTQAWIKFQQD